MLIPPAPKNIDYLNAKKPTLRRADYDNLEKKLLNVSRQKGKKEIAQTIRACWLTL